MGSPWPPAVSDLGIPLALAIGIQNIPEGFAAAAPLLATGTTRWAAAGIAALRAVIDAAAELYVVTPTLPGRLAWLADDVDRVRHIADERLTRCSITCGRSAHTSQVLRHVAASSR